MQSAPLLSLSISPSPSPSLFGLLTDVCVCVYTISLVLLSFSVMNNKATGSCCFAACFSRSPDVTSVFSLCVCVCVCVCVFRGPGVCTQGTVDYVWLEGNCREGLLMCMDVACVCFASVCARIGND